MNGTSSQPSAPYVAKLARPSSPLQRLKSRLKREIIARTIPQSVLVTRGAVSAKRVALTFDDGPDEMTGDYLELLDKLGVRATFFLIGANAEKRPDLVLEYVRRGHEVAGHGFTHKAFPTLPPVALVDELTRTNDLLPPSGGRRPFVRPPQGRITFESMLRVAAASYTTVLWSLDSDDCRTREPDVVMDRVSPRTVQPGEIVLLHEYQPWTLQALPCIVENLRNEGFSFATVGELLGQ